MIHKCRSTQINKQWNSSWGIKGQWYPDRGIRLLDLWWRGSCCAYIIMSVLCTLAGGCKKDDCQTPLNCSVWLEQSEWKSSCHDISPEMLNHRHRGGVLEIQMDQCKNSRNNANHHNRILLRIVMLPKSSVPWIWNTHQTELEMICELLRKCRWSSASRRSKRRGRDRGRGFPRNVGESLFVFNIKINESKQNNKSSEKLNCNDVVLSLISSTSRSTRVPTFPLYEP